MESCLWKEIQWRRKKLQFYGGLEEICEFVGQFAVGDYVPWLHGIDRLNGLEAKIDEVALALDTILERILVEHLDGANTQSNNDGNSDKRERVKDFVDVLLEVQKDNKVGGLMERECVKALILDLFAAGTDTIWAISELLRHPRILTKLQEEVRRFTQGKATVNEHDLEKMNYLKAVIKETLRLHAPIPLLVFRESRDVKINGFYIAERTQVIINAWAIQRNPSLWEEPNEIYPERFMTCAVDYKGQHFN